MTLDLDIQTQYIVTPVIATINCPMRSQNSVSSIFLTLVNASMVLAIVSRLEGLTSVQPDTAASDFIAKAGWHDHV